MCGLSVWSRLNRLRKVKKHTIQKDNKFRGVICEINN